MSRFDHILHRADGVTTAELNSQVGTFRAVTSAKLIAVRQDVSSAELTLVSSEAFTVNVGDWIEAKGMRLYCMSTIDRYTCSEDNNREYQLTFYDPIYYLRQAIFYNTYESESEGVYSYSRVDNTYPSVGTFEDFVKLCCYNCNFVQGVRMFKVGTISESIATDIRVLNFSDYNCLAVLKQTCEEFETTWRVRINEGTDSLFIIDFGVEIEDFPVTLEVEKSKGLLSIEVTASDKDVFTQFVVKGGTDNLPSDYPHTNLQLDEDLEGTPPVYANSMIKKPELYARWGKSVKELVNENIKPSRTGTVTAIDENILKFFDSDLIGAEWSPAGGTIHFVSGHLIGFTFNCQGFNSETGEITIESAEENNGFILPSSTDSYYRINEGDKYNIAGVSLPASYVTAAKEELKEWALIVINGYWSQQRIESVIKIDPSIISVDIVPNMGFYIIHNALGIDKIIMAKQVVYDLSLEHPYDIESITVSDWATDDSRADTLHRRVALAQILAKKKQQKGDKGEAGEITYTWIMYSDYSDGTDLYDTPNENTIYIGLAANKTTQTPSTTKTDYTWSKFKGDQGVAGEDGVTTYTWIKYSDNADGTGLYDTPTANTLYIGIAVNKTTASESTVKTDYVWSKFKGEQGNQGIQGIPGPPGENGVTYYTWVKYADTPTTGMSDYPSGKAYLGIAYNKTTATESENYADYSWSLIKGTDGQPGADGADGQTLYTWIKYADTPTSGMSDSPTGKTYIGIAVNKTTSVESSTYADYTWSLIKGTDGIDGIDGEDGEPGPIGKRVVSGLVYYQLSASTAPDAPTATSFDFDNNSFTGLTENWALTPPVFEAGNANKFWYVGFYVEESASESGTGTPVFSTVKQSISFSGLVTFTGDNTVTDGTKTLSFGETGTTEINGGKITTGKVAAARIEVEDLIVKCLLTDVDDQGFRFDIRTINIDNDQVSQFRLYDPDSSEKAKIEMQGSGSEVYMNIENEEIGTSTDKDGFHVNDIDENGNKTERVKLANGEMSLSDINTNKGLLVKADKITFQQRVGDETKEVAAISVDTIPRMIFASDWSGMTESQKKAIPLAYIYDLNNTITNIYRYGGYAIPGTNVTLYASGVTSTDNKWSDMNNALGDTPSTFAYCNKYNEEPRLYLAFDVITLPLNAIITQFTIEAKVKGALGWMTTNKIWGGVLLDESEQWDWDIANNDTEQLRYTSRAGQFTKNQMANMRALFRSDLNGNAAAGREVLVYYAKLTLTYVTS